MKPYRSPNVLPKINDPIAIKSVAGIQNGVDDINAIINRKIASSGSDFIKSEY